MFFLIALFAIGAIAISFAILGALWGSNPIMTLINSVGGVILCLGSYSFAGM